MKTVFIEVDASGARVDLRLVEGHTSGRALLVLGDDVEVAGEPTGSSTSKLGFQELKTPSGFPPRSLTKQTIVQILREHGGSVRIRDDENRWNIYDEVAARLGVSQEARRRPTAGTGEPAWRPEVGFCRKDLEQSRIIEPTATSGVGVWSLSNKQG